MSDSTYTLTAEQDNWVFAPNGGVGLLKNSKTPIVFFPNKIIMEIVDKYYLDENTYNGNININWENYFGLNSIADANYKTCEKQVHEALRESFKYGENNFYKILDAASEIIEDVSFALFLTPETTITKATGAVLTVAGYFINDLSKAIQEENEKLKFDLIDALFDGDLNIVYLHMRTEMSKGEYEIDNWIAWMTPNYIDKYIDGFRMEVSLIEIATYSINN